MKIFDVKPFSFVGCIEFEMPREIVRKNMGSYMEFKKNMFSRNTTDDFDFCHVYYDTENKVEAVEFLESENVAVVYKGECLFSLGESNIIHLFNDKSFKKEDDTLIFPDYGVEVLVEEKQIKSVFIHKLGY